MNQQISSSQKPKFTFFGAAMFLRPKNPEKRIYEQAEDISLCISLAQKNPENWECLFMKRNYLDFCWDHIGGHNEVNEFPAQTMLREVQEEVGWKIKSYKEVCRQWKKGFLNGFIYVCVPEEKLFMLDTPPRVPCQEVQTVQYFNLIHILKSPDFKPNVKGRIQSLISNESDFSLQ